MNTSYLNYLTKEIQNYRNIHQGYKSSSSISKYLQSISVHNHNTSFESQLIDH